MGKFFSRRNLLLVDICLFILMGITLFAVISLTFAAARLNPDGSAFELNLDEQGKLWISDSKAKQVWNVDPASGAYEIYSVSGSPVDARQADGWMWWAAGQSNTIGQVSTNNGTFTEWQVPDAPGFLGTSLDASGRFYATDSSNPYLYRLDPKQAELCTFTLPGFGASNYIVRDGEYLWLGGWFDSTIERFNVGDNSLTWWRLPAGSSPFGMAVDNQGSLWYADQGNKMLAQLDPASNQLTGYLLPKGDNPQMIASQSGLIWYSEQSLPGFGSLDPSKAAKEVITLEIQDQLLTPSCVSISPSDSGKILIEQGKLRWSNHTYKEIVSSGGWHIYQMPENSDPWGIALADYGYVVDSGRQVLVRFLPSQALPPILLATGTSTPPINPTQTQSALSTAIPTAIPTALPTPELFHLYLPIVLRDSPVAISPEP